MSSRSISGELSRKIIIAVAILVLGGVFGLIEFSGRIITEFTKKNAEGSINKLTSDIEAVLGQVSNVTSSLDWLMAEHAYDPAYVRSLDEKVLEDNKLFLSFTFAFVPEYSKKADAYLAVVSSRNMDTGVISSTEVDDYAQEKWFTEPLQRGEGFWSEPARTADGTALAVRYSEPVKDGQGNVIGVLSAEVSISALTSYLAKDHFYDSSYTVVMSSQANVIAHPDSNYLLVNLKEFVKKLDDKKFAEAIDKMAAGEKGIGTIKATQSVAIFGPVNNGWSCAIISSGKEVFGGVVKFQLLLLLFAIMDLILLYVVTKLIIGRTLIPITEVTYLAKNVAKGNFKAEIPQAKGHTEIFHLHEALRNMLKSINEYIAQLKTTTAANERFESELSIASEIQKQMLRTDFINDEEVDLYATLKPAKEVGGDMYDFLRVDRQIYFAVGDVSGKGVPAALYMAISRSLFHYVSGMSLNTNGVAACINSSFCSGNDTNMFITMFIGRFDLDTRELVFCNAGHNPIVVIGPDGKASYLHAKSNMAAGVFDEFPYEKESIILEKGSRLLIYTDGVSEAENAVKDQYGEDRLIEFAGSQDVNLSSEEFVENLYQSVKAFTKENPQNDDITIMSVKL